MFFRKKHRLISFYEVSFKKERKKAHIYKFVCLYFYIHIYYLLYIYVCFYKILIYM